MQFESVKNDIQIEQFLFKRPSDEEAMQLSHIEGSEKLMSFACQLRDQHFNHVMTYSRKVFIPITQLCRDVCHYCTFAQSPRVIKSPYMTVEQVLESAKEAHKLGCKEALFTLGEKPELRYNAARDALAELGFNTTLEYVAYLAKRVTEETGLFVHINPGCMNAGELDMLRPVSASMGMMLESASERLCEKGMPHYGSPDKLPAARLKTIELAGEQKVPFTSGILIGIGETRQERIESLLALRKLHKKFGHLQEIIIQNFRAKPNTRMASAPEPNLADLQWTIAIARIIFGPHMSIQAPPNLSPGLIPALVSAGINDWGGISPVTPDYVNPEAPWPNIEDLSHQVELEGKYLQERLTIYPQYAVEKGEWLDPLQHTKLLQAIDAEGFPRTDDWFPGLQQSLPDKVLNEIHSPIKYQQVSSRVRDIVSRASLGEPISESDIVRLFQARGGELGYVVQNANMLRSKRSGEKVGYVVNRNINYTNVCYFKCQFCAFSKGKLSENLRGKPYNLDLKEIGRRVKEAWKRGATEVCMQGGIHPSYTGQTYLDILHTVRKAAPDIHIHAFSALEVWQGAKTLGLSIPAFLAKLKEAGLNSLPGTAAEVLDEEVRQQLCPDKINTEQWMKVMRAAHDQGLATTATIMFGHIDEIKHWARHLSRIRKLQKQTGGFTEFVPLPFVHMEAPIYLKGKSRKGPTFRESILMHSVSRLVLQGQIDNIQVSWVKMGEQGVLQALNAGANDLGGTLMNETITRAAGATNGQEIGPTEMDALITEIDRIPQQRTTLYKEVTVEKRSVETVIPSLELVVNTPIKRQRIDKSSLVFNPSRSLVE